MKVRCKMGQGERIEAYLTAILLAALETYGDPEVSFEYLSTVQADDHRSEERKAEKVGLCLLLKAFKGLTK